VRLLVVTNLFFPDRGGGASVFSDLCFSLVRRGWEVDVFTTYPYYPEWRRRSGRSVWSIEREDIQGVRVWRHGIYVPAKPGKLAPRLAYELSFTLSLLRSLFRGGTYDLVMVYCPLLGAVTFSALRKMLIREPLWLNVQDIPADAADASGISKSKLFSRMAGHVQQALFNAGDVWSTISPVMADRLRGMMRREQPLYVFPNWLNGSMAQEIAGLPSDKLGRAPRNPLRLLYAGNIGKKQGLLEFCRALAATDAAFHFTICGDGSERVTMERFCQDCEDKRFEMRPFLEEKEFVRALHDTDVFVITEKSGSGASFIPSKLIPGIATGTPVLAVCDKSGPLGREMEEACLGLRMDWDRLSGLADALNGLQSDTEAFRKYQVNALQHSRNYSREHAVQRFMELAQGHLKGHAPRNDCLFAPTV
jgi:colanic acid biosynthesis glycosyl transferase WcaI